MIIISSDKKNITVNDQTSQIDSLEGKQALQDNADLLNAALAAVDKKTEIPPSPTANPTYLRSPTLGGPSQPTQNIDPAQIPTLIEKMAKFKQKSPLTFSFQGEPCTAWTDEFWITIQFGNREISLATDGRSAKEKKGTWEFGEAKNRLINTNATLLHEALAAIERPSPPPRPVQHRHRP